MQLLRAHLDISLQTMVWSKRKAIYSFSFYPHDFAKHDICGQTYPKIKVQTVIQTFTKSVLSDLYMFYLPS